MDLSEASKLAFNGRRVCVLNIDGRRVPAACQNSILVKLTDMKQHDVYESEGFPNNQLSIKTALVEERLAKSDSSLSDIASIEDISSLLSSIDDNCLANLDNIRDIHVLSVQNVGQQACLSCTRLSSFVGIEVKNVGIEGFKGCISLSSMHFRQLESLGSRAFMNCEQLAQVQISSTTLPTTSTDAFVGAGSKTVNAATEIRVRDQLYKSYIADSNWVTMKDRISSFTQPTVSFLSGIMYDTLISKQTLNYGMSAIVPFVVRHGYELIGWNGNYNDVMTDTSCYAIWNAVNYSISYDLNGGTNDPDNPATYTIESEDIVFKPAFKADFDFDKWVDANGNQITSILHGSYGDKSISAIWKQSKVNLTYDTGYDESNED